MKAKRVMKYLLIGLIVLLIGKVVFQKTFDDRPFKFEKYKSSEELEAAAKLKFFVGGDIDQIVSDLRKSSAKCFAPKCYGPCENFENRFHCRYQAGLFSLRPFDGYSVTVYLDKNRKLTKLTARRLPTIIFGS